MHNPYTPPATPSAPQTNGKLYSPSHIAWATFLGAPIAGCVLMALNYRRLDNSAGARLALLLGAIATILIMAIAFVLPDNFPNSLLPAAYTFAMFQTAKSMQGSMYDQHIANGDSKASGWAATGIGILSLLCIVVALFAFVFFAPEGWFPE